MNSKFKKKFYNLLPYLVAAVLFIVIALTYCKPILSGKVLFQSDVKQWEGMAHEVISHKEATGDISYWTNSMFSGMPDYQISWNVPSVKMLKPIKAVSHLFFNNSILFILLGYFIGFFILLRSFGINKWISIIGSIAISFSSYFFIIIAAGHESKAITLGILAPVIAGFILLFRKKYFWGFALTVLYSAMGLLSHPQMSYYIFMMLGIFGIAEIYIHIKEKKVKDLIISLLLFVLAIGIGIGTGYSKLSSNSEYLKETMRGGHSDLKKTVASVDKSSGLDLEYATQWSYGIDETMTLLIPNYKGGSSNYNVGTNSKMFKTLIENKVPRNEATNLCKGLPLYWGKQPFTSGPVYVGAIIFFLFIFGLFIVKGPYKWALLVATLFSVFLSWGSNFMGLTKFFFNYFPFYDKFRTVSSILVVAEIAIPLLAFLSIKAIMDRTVSKEKMINALRNSVIITGGICLFFALFGPILYNFTAQGDASIFGNLPKWFGDAIINERISMFRSDSLRSLFFILFGGATIWLFVKEKIKFKYFALALGVLVIVDMWPVNKRFFNDDMFVSKRQDANYFSLQPYEKQILEDKDPDFRVANFTTDTFKESRTSYYFKSIGGYHAAKLRRYQDLIDNHFAVGNQNVYNMLNTKYFIFRDKGGNFIVNQNPSRCGNGWFVDSVYTVETPNEESDALNTIDLMKVAVTDVKFKDFVKERTAVDSTAKIVLTKYAPDALEYRTSSNVNKTAVFSEIYYPYGWNAYIDNVPTKHFRVNYVLRALNIPAGDHIVKFEFRPDSIYKGDKISIVFIIIMYGIVLFFIGYSIYRYNKKRKISITKQK
ncbi:MAG: YfhO family protein [Bacteroidales bacterium]|jgi:hypothetical protein